MSERQLSLSPMDLVTFPVSSFLWLVSEIRDMAEREMFDPETISHQLLELQEAYELGEIDEAEYERTWTEYTEHLEAAIEWRRPQTPDDIEGPDGE